MNRRDFLLLRKADEATEAELSCEQLFMRCVDSMLDGSTADLFGDIEQRLFRVRTLRLIDAAWLGCEELKPLEVILKSFRQRGGQLDYSPPKLGGDALA
jgi:hypothetical protein